MTISDEPDEDADFLDDEGLMDSFIRPDYRTRSAKSHPRAAMNDAGSNDEVMNDWPPPRAQGSAERGAVSWFRANHADWSAQMEAVLRGWILAQVMSIGSEADTTSQQLSSHTGPEAIEPE